ncbi:hypothetical protein CMI47_12730 [Candidatus Pacearchaeota archaeon]|nr:hypothetical protein [Candidatus Pacearchaeota archaeon]|tara:strand:+ start:63452 stop:63934 length:483 start_codon:yes stop_codon:yes gene_type:complete
MNNSVKHIITCRCILTQHRRLNDPPFFSFIVFSLFNKQGDIIPKLVKCTYCGVTHKVYEVCKSEIISTESENIVNKEDISLFLPQKLSTILNDYNCELYIFEEAKYIIDNKLWENIDLPTPFLILTREEIKNNDKHFYEGKMLKIYDEFKYSIEYWKSNY